MPNKKLATKAKRSSGKKPAVKKKINFEKLSRSQKRVAIARDIIAQIKAEKLIATSGSYIKMSEKNYNLMGTNLDIQKNYSNISNCKVCAVGAAIMSCTKLGNRLKFEDIGADRASLYNDNVKGLISEIFTPKQLLLIENAFESTYRNHVRFATDVLESNDSLSYAEEVKCDRFYKEHCHDSNERLTAICKNIIKNKGTFRP